MSIKKLTEKDKEKIQGIQLRNGLNNLKTCKECNQRTVTTFHGTSGWDDHYTSWKCHFCGWSDRND